MPWEPFIFFNQVRWQTFQGAEVIPQTWCPQICTYILKNMFYIVLYCFMFSTRTFSAYVCEALRNLFRIHSWSFLFPVLERILQMNSLGQQLMPVPYLSHWGKDGNPKGHSNALAPEKFVKFWSWLNKKWYKMKQFVKHGVHKFDAEDHWVLFEDGLQFLGDGLLNISWGHQRRCGR